MILTTAALATISSFTSGTLSSYFAKKALDAYFSNDANFKDELRDVIENTIQEYDGKFPQESGRDLPFYHSANVIDQLLKFRVMKPEEYNRQDLLEALQAESGIMPPTAQNLNDFFELFMMQINASENLKKLEIKETFAEEVFAIARGIDGLKSHIDSLAKSYTGDLELQWKNRVDTYVKAIQAFKPATALSLLESLEESLVSSDRRPGVNFMAFLEYQKAVCLGFLHRHHEAYKAYIKSWRLDKSQLLFAEKVAIAYYKLGEFPLATQVSEEILTKDGFNPVAWVIKLLVAPFEDFEDLLKTAPLSVKTDRSFIRMLYNTSNDEGNLVHQKLYDLGMVPSCLDYQELPVNVDTFNTVIYWINVCTREIFNYFYFDFREVNQAQQPQIRVLNGILLAFLGTIRDSEIFQNYRHLDFIFAFTNFSLYQEEKYALEMEAAYSSLPVRDFVFTMHCANTLQLSGYPERAIALIEANHQNEPELLLLLLYCYQNAEQNENYLKGIKRFAAAITVFHPHYLLMFVNLMVELKLSGEIAQFSIGDFLDGKTFEQSSDEALVNTLASLIFEGPSDELVSTLKQIAEDSEDPLLVDVIGSALFCTNRYEDALVVLGKNIETKEGGRELYQYITAKSNLGKDHKQLLDLLKNWRLKLDFNTGFLRLEAKMRRDLLEWPEIIEICEYYLPRHPEDEDMLTLYVYALNMINNAESIAKIKSLSASLLDVPFAFDGHLKSICNTLITHGEAMNAFELMYRHASDSSRVDLRMAYFSMCFRVSKEGPGMKPLEEFAEAAEDTFVKYERDGKISFVELNEVAKSHPVHSKFFGAKPGDAIQVKRPMGNIEDTVTIKRVMNKFLCLHDQIIYQAEDDPYSGLPMTALKFDPDTPGSFLETLATMFGDNTGLVKQTREADYQAYYAGELSLSELVKARYANNYCDAYYSLIRFHKGIFTVPEFFFRNQIKADTVFVLDESSLLMLYQLKHLHGTVFPHKFIISKYIVERLKTELRNLQYGIDRDFSVNDDIASGLAEVSALVEFTKNHTEHLQGLLDWIAENCLVELSDRTLEFIEGADLNVGENPVIDAAMSTTLLVQDADGRVLISDDVIYLRFGFLAIDHLRSAENYVKTTLGADLPELDEFVRNRYIKFSPSARQLNGEYLKHSSGLPSEYTLILENVSITNSGENLEAALGHIKEIALNAVIGPDKMLRDITAVFVNLLRGAVPDVIEVIRLKVFLDFRLLGTKQDEVMHAYHDAVKIIVSGNQQ